MIPTFSDIEDAAIRIAPHAARTPLLWNAELNERVGGRVWLKCETLQRTGSFKFRGAYNAISALSVEERRNGVVASSSGNHAQGVAAAAALFGIGATIIMPDDAPLAKIEGTRRRGAAIVPYNRASDDRDAMAEETVVRTGGRLIHAYNNPMVIAGQGTIGLEIADTLEEQGETADAVLLPCGGGGMSAGTGLALKTRMPAIEVYLVEPAGFDDYGRSLAAGTPQQNAKTSGSICDALMAPKPGEIGFAINSKTASGAVAVEDAEVLDAIAFAFRSLKLVVEPGGAAGLAALLSGRFPVEGRSVVVVLSGGNIDPPMLARALASS